MGGRDVVALPKAELHVHLLGAMRAATVTELAAGLGVATPDPRAFTTFAEFQRVFDAVFALTATSVDALLRLVREVVEDAAADGAVWVQPHFTPHAYPALGSPGHVLGLVLAEGRAVGARVGVGFGVTVAAAAHLGPAHAVTLARFAARHAGRGVHAFGLTGDEAAHPAALFTRAFAIARDAGLVSAPHAGELAGAASVRAAVESLGAARIAHGVRAVEDPAVVALLAERGVTLDVCLTSNARLGVVPDVAAHPLPRLLAAGVRCSLGADDPLMFGVTLAGEYRLARDALRLPDADLAALARTSIATSGAPADVVARGLAGVDRWLATEPAEHAGG